MMWHEVEAFWMEEGEPESVTLSFNGGPDLARSQMRAWLRENVSVAVASRATMTSARMDPLGKDEGERDMSNLRLTATGERIIDRTKDGKPLSFTVNSAQLWHDDWRNVDRVMRYYGECYCCGIRTYAFDDGENDPRGVLGNHAADTFHLADHLSMDDAAKVNKINIKDIPACFGCTNEYDRYQMLIDVGTRRARSKGADI